MKTEQVVMKLRKMKIFTSGELANAVIIFKNKNKGQPPKVIIMSPSTLYTFLNNERQCFNFGPDTTFKRFMDIKIHRSLDMEEGKFEIH